MPKDTRLIPTSSQVCAMSSLTVSGLASIVISTFLLNSKFTFNLPNIFLIIFALNNDGVPPPKKIEFTTDLSANCNIDRSISVKSAFIQLSVESACASSLGV